MTNNAIVLAVAGPHLGIFFAVACVRLYRDAVSGKNFSAGFTSSKKTWRDE